MDRINTHHTALLPYHRIGSQRFLPATATVPMNLKLELESKSSQPLFDFSRSIAFDFNSSTYTNADRIQP